MDPLSKEAIISGNEAEPVTTPSGAGLPMGRIGHVEISRVIIGSNLFAGGAHSRDLRYVGSLLRHYFTHEKVMDTLQLCEENGINTSIGGGGIGGRGVRQYNEERGGNLQLIAQLQCDLEVAQKAIDRGAVGAFIHGGRADLLIRDGKTDQIAEFVSFVKKNGLIAGVGGHSKNVPIICEEAGVGADFYFKTLHHDNYFSATYFSATPKQYRVEYAADHGVPTCHDNMWSLFPEVTIEFMKNVEIPWIAYKVLAAGAIHPREGFRYAFENGADFVCVGMLDYQVEEDVGIAKDILAELEKTGRDRPWEGKNK